MRVRKTRLTVTVDPAFVHVGNHAVATGNAESLSAWVNLALAERAAKEHRLRAMGQALAAYENRFGVITPEEIAAQERADRQSARVVRGTRSAGRQARHRRRSAA